MQAGARVLAIAIIAGPVPVVSATPPCADYADQIRMETILPVGDAAHDVVIQGDVAYVAAGSAGLRIYDLADPWSPALIGTLATLGTALGVDVEGSTAYVADSTFVLVVDVSDPEFPLPTAALPTPGEAQDLVEENGLLFVADGTAGLQIFDLTGPAPRHVGTSRPSSVESGRALARGGQDYVDVVASGSWAYVAAQFGDVRVVDASNPASPVEVAVISDIFAADGVDLAGNTLYIAARFDGLVTADVSDPFNPQVLGEVDFGVAWSVRADGPWAYLGSAGPGVTVVDVTDPAVPEAVGLVGNAGFGQEAFAVSGKAVYAALGGTGLGVIDRRFRTSIAPVERTPLDVRGSQYRVHGTRAVASGGFGVQVLDVSVPAAPAALGWLNPPGFESDVAFDGSYVYVINGDADLHVIDATDPANPSILSTTSIGTFFSAGSLLIDGSLLWASVPFVGLQAVDVSSPATPLVVGTLPLPRPGVSMQRVGDILYVGQEIDGLLAIDVSDPTMPSLVTSFPTVATEALWIEGGILYTAYGFGFGVWQLLDPLTPVAIGSATLPSAGVEMQVYGDFAYVSGGGATVVDVTDPALPRPVGVLKSAAEPPGRSIAVVGDVLHLPTWEHLAVYAPQCAVVAAPVIEPSRAASLLAAPNPFRDGTVLRTTLERPGLVRADVFDPAGRRVRELERSVRPAGPLSLTWDGRDDSGRAAPSGVYFVRLRSETRSDAVKVVRTR